MKSPTSNRPRLRREQLRNLRWVWSLGGLTVPELARRTWRAIVHEDTLGRAAELSYYFLFSLFPILICVSAAVGLVFNTERDLYIRTLGYLETVMPPNAYTIISGAANDLSAGAGGGKLSLGLLVALWTASLGMDAVIKGLNTAYNVREFRPWWRRRIVAMVLTAVCVVLMLLALLMILAGGQIGDWLAKSMPGTFIQEIWATLKWLIAVVFTLIALNLIYLFGPNLKEQRWRAILPGSLVAFACWIIASLGFRLYLQYFDSYSKTYGSLGAVIVLLTWLYLSGAAILIGGEVNAQIRTAAAEAGAREAQRIDESPS